VHIFKQAQMPPWIRVTNFCQGPEFHA